MKWAVGLACFDENTNVLLVNKLFHLESVVHPVFRFKLHWSHVSQTVKKLRALTHNYKSCFPDNYYFCWEITAEFINIQIYCMFYQMRKRIIKTIAKSGKMILFIFVWFCIKWEHSSSTFFPDFVKTRWTNSVSYLLQIKNTLPV